MKVMNNLLTIPVAFRSVFALLMLTSILEAQPAFDWVTRLSTNGWSQAGPVAVDPNGNVITSISEQKFDDQTCLRVPLRRGYGPGGVVLPGHARSPAQIRVARLE